MMESFIARRLYKNEQGERRVSRPAVLIAQIGVALGMAMTAASLESGTLARNVVLFAVLIYELVGPMLTKRSLLAVGEIKPEGRTSARKLNADAGEAN